MNGGGCVWYKLQQLLPQSLSGNSFLISFIILTALADASQLEVNLKEGVGGTAAGENKTWNSDLDFFSTKNKSCHCMVQSSYYPLELYHKQQVRYCLHEGRSDCCKRCLVRVLLSESNSFIYPVSHVIIIFVGNP
ncbi:hypothetical protein PROFUN_12532 [Planoprotostelium fungivorum]|uniref:Uncharacterized protein n=1 Tax=Planoprotostelium fungivorum TaxID=1890364 RepID=A0A2P6MS34_9EUKA|nr:hypothetical protein PROFUN_12532 [Planoprotostelium fungivorum]